VRLSLLFALVVAAATLFVAAGPAAANAPTDATPPIHLQGAAFSVTQARFQWTPGKENHYFCVDYAKSMTDLLQRSGTWRNSGCGTTSNSHVVDNLACGTRYFVRVWTSAGGGLYSQPVTVQTYSCATAISAPTNLGVVFTTSTTARLDWKPGKDNRWFCVDTARSPSDLLHKTGTWRNHACWTTSSQVTISGLKCGTVYYWRVYAWNKITNIHSGYTYFVTASCDTTLEKADIEDVDVDKVDGDYRAEIEVSKPNTCHSFGAYDSETSGNVIEITVYNEVSGDSCTATPGATYTLTINLGSGFFSGVTYVVIVNDDETDFFTAS
jgi:hypothetical protein